VNPCGHSPYVTPSLTRRWGCLLWIYTWPFVKCRYRTYNMLLKIFLWHFIQVFWQYRLCKAHHAYLCYNGSLADSTEILVPDIESRYGSHTKYLFHYCVLSRCRGKNLPTELFPSNGCRTVASLHSCYFDNGSTHHNSNHT
jgi:hypothetical protein